MKWIRTQEETLPQFKSCVLSVGNFDGVHLGHQNLIKTLISKGEEYSVPKVVCTFKPHPKVVLRPNEPHHRLFDYRDQSEVMEKLGVDYLIEEKFSKDFSLMSADQFLQDYVEKIYNPVHLVVGHDFSFGKSRVGNIEFLKSYCEEKKLGLSVVPAFKLNGLTVSTSKIKEFLQNGNTTKAQEFLGRPYYLRGPVRVGHRRGRTIGVPTANISPEIEFIPRKGVYFTWCYIAGIRYASITNIGFNPTFDSLDSYLKVETHIFNFDQEIYGEHMAVELIQFHRDEKKFSSIEDLKSQIHTDMYQAKNFFGAV